MSIYDSVFYFEYFDIYIFETAAGVKGRIMTNDSAGQIVNSLESLNFSCKKIYLLLFMIHGNSTNVIIHLYILASLLPKSFVLMCL